MTVIYATFHRRRVEPIDELFAAAILAERRAERLKATVDANCDRQLEAARNLLTQVHTLLAGMDGNGGCR